MIVIVRAFAGVIMIVIVRSFGGVVMVVAIVVAGHR
jgi:hypothetical protein